MRYRQKQKDKNRRHSDSHVFSKSKRIRRRADDITIPIPCSLTDDPMIASKFFSSVFKNGGSLVVYACFFASTCVAAIVSPTVSVTITQSYAYTNFDGGDFVFSTSAGAPGCASGWYIKAADPGYKVAVATVLTAQAGGNYVLVYGDNADLWSGSPSGQYCHVQTIGITS
jgi:hypothetical protein